MSSSSSRSRVTNVATGHSTNANKQPAGNVPEQPNLDWLIDQIGAWRQSSTEAEPRSRVVIPTSISFNTASRSVKPVNNADGTQRTTNFFQSLHDVGFNIQIPSSQRARFFPGLSPIHIEIYYDPATDNCVIVNMHENEVQIARLDDENPVMVSLEYERAFWITPNLWRLWDFQNYHVFDMLLMARHFTVEHVQDDLADPANGKRKRLEDSNNDDGKRLREDRGGTEIVVARSQTSHQVSADQNSPAPLSGGDVLSTFEQGSLLANVKAGDVVNIFYPGPMAPSSTASQVPALQVSASRFSYKVKPSQIIKDTDQVLVYVARHTKLAGDVVAKVLKFYGSEAENLMIAARMWQKEFTALRGISHPNIVKLKWFDGTQFAMYLERLPPSLNDYGSQCTLTSHDAHRILSGICSALAHLKTRKILHNDVKPGNITYSPERGAVLIDFGFATTDNRHTPDGTPWYIPPENANGAPRDQLSDIWALGVTMLYVLRKISLPEKENSSNVTSEGWHINELDNDQELYDRQTQWYEQIERQRSQLDISGNPIEALVDSMLLGHSHRSDADEILRKIEGFKSSGQWIVD